MLTPEASSERALDGLLQHAAAAEVPAAGAFELTSRCNLACRMCYIRQEAGGAPARSGELSAEAWVALAREAARAGMLFLLLTGGEAFLRPDFLAIYRPLTELGLHLTIYSNATLVTPALARALAAQPPNRIGVTLYGASPATYQAVTGSKQAFAQALRGLDLLLEAGLSVAIRTTLTRRNWHDRAAIQELARQRGLPLVRGWLLTCRPDGAPSHAREDRLSPAQVVTLEAADPASRERWSAVPSSPEVAADGPLSCHAGRAAFVVGPSGKMNPCMDLPVAAARPLESGFLPAWERVRASVSDLPSQPHCRACGVRAYCGLCPAIASAEAEPTPGARPYYCALADERQRFFGGGRAAEAPIP